MTDNLTLQKDMDSSLRDVVFHTLRDAILTGELRPQERLMETQLAARLGVSRTPVREAIRKLEAEGLALTNPHRGARVAGLNEKDLENVLEIRNALEELAVFKAANRISKEMLTKMEETTEAFETAISRGDPRQIVEIDEEFHQIIYRASENPRLYAIIQKLKGQMFRYRYEYAKDTADAKKLLDEHRQIIKHLKNRDAEAAMDAIRIHLHNQLEGVRKMIRENADGES